MIFWAGKIDTWNSSVKYRNKQKCEAENDKNSAGYTYRNQGAAGNLMISDSSF